MGEVQEETEIEDRRQGAADSGGRSPGDRRERERELREKVEVREQRENGGGACREPRNPFPNFFFFFKLKNAPYNFTRWIKIEG